MSRPRSVPKYRRHKSSGQAVVTLPDGLGRRRDVLLGKYGSKESRQEYTRVIAEWEVNGRRPSAMLQGPADLSVNELLFAYWQFIESYYRLADGTPSSEVANVKRALRQVKQLYGHTPAANFDSLCLEAVRNAMVQEGHCRNLINKDVPRIKRMFKWAASKKLVPVSVWQSLSTVEGLRAGRSEARETEPIGPVPLANVEATLPYLLPQTAAMVQLQLLTGMRPGEVVRMRSIDLDTTGPVWLYRPAQHKNAWRGHKRSILIGPKGQEILRPWLRLNVEEYLFSPREAMEQKRAEMRAKRKTKVQPSQQNRRKRRARKRPGERYRTASFAVAVATACKKAGVPHWHPNQLRHAKATEIRKEAGLDAARAVLGHRSPSITEVYAEIDMAKAAEVMAKLG